MGNYMGISFTDEGDSYGTNKLFTKEPQFYWRIKSSDADWNFGDFDDEDLDELRVGYPEPAGTVELSGAHIRALPTIMYALLGNYLYTEGYTTETVVTGKDKDGNDITKTVNLNMHEFWAGNGLEVPEWCANMIYEVGNQTMIDGAVMDSFEINAGLNKTTAECGFVYRNEQSKEINVETVIQNKNILQALPLVGYDWTVTLTVNDDTTDEQITPCFNEVNISINNNILTGDDVRCLGKDRYGFKPSMEKREIEVTGKIKLTPATLPLINKLKYKGNTKSDGGWRYWNKCHNIDGSLKLRATSCLDSAEWIEFYFPKAAINIDPIKIEDGNVDVDLSLKLYNTKKVHLTQKVDPTKEDSDYIQVVTPMRVKIQTRAGKVE